MPISKRGSAFIFMLIMIAVLLSLNKFVLNEYLKGKSFILEVSLSLLIFLIYVGVFHFINQKFYNKN